jgi:hypothetical protein
MLAAVTGPAVRTPVLIPAAVTEPDTLTPAAVIEDDARTDDAVISTAVTAPVEDNPALVSTPAEENEVAVTLPADETPLGPTEIEPAVRDPEVITPVDETLADRIRPVMLTALATKFPATVVVFKGSDPITIEEDAEPMRTTPTVKPVPASSCRSPPTLLASPAA